MASCKNCNQNFEITQDDEKFYSDMSVPHPTHCPDCRLQRRLSFRNERRIYKRRSDFSGKNIISIYSADKPYKVYQYDEWMSESWSAQEYGQEIAWNKTFFHQFYELQLKVPRIALHIQARNQNSPYVNYATGNKNCYLVVAANANENSYYSLFINSCKNCADCLFIFKSELCYECVDCLSCFRLIYGQSSEQCSDSIFLYDCQGVSNCVGCVGLTHKSYYWLNEPLSKEEFQKKYDELMAQGRPALEKLRKEFNELILKYPRLFMHGRQNENVLGDYVYNSKNSINCFDVRHVWDCKYCIWLHNSKNCYDYYAWGNPAEKCLECLLIGDNAYNVKFSRDCWQNVSNLEYCDLCVSSKNCFGCIGLRNAQFCIFNKQYSESHYKELTAKLRDFMLKTHEYGEFFPIQSSPFGYNESVAMQYFPATQEEAKSKKYQWKREEIGKYLPQDYVVNYSIQNTADKIVEEILQCQECHKNYRILEQELDLYRTLRVPIPLKCCECRENTRKNLRNPRKLFSRVCMQCGIKLQSSYAQDYPAIIYCEKCYLAEKY